MNWKERLTALVQRVRDLAQASDDAMVVSGVDAKIDAMADELFAEYGDVLTEALDIAGKAAPLSVPPIMVKRFVEDLGQALLARVDEARSRATLGTIGSDAASAGVAFPGDPSTPAPVVEPNAADAIVVAESGRPAEVIRPKPGDPGFHV